MFYIKTKYLNLFKIMIFIKFNLVKLRINFFFLKKVIKAKCVFREPDTPKGFRVCNRVCLYRCYLFNHFESGLHNTGRFKVMGTE